MAQELSARWSAKAQILNAPGWNLNTRKELEQLIRRGAGKGLPVVLDFDNTIICGDVSEATLAVLTNSGLLNRKRLPATLSPAFRPSGKGRISLESCLNVTEYYNAFLAPSAHGPEDPTPLSNGYVWAVEVMEGLTPLQVIQATRRAYEMGQLARARNGQKTSSDMDASPERTGEHHQYPPPVYIEVNPGKTAFPIPFFYPEMVELIGAFIRHRFDVWIVSAGNVWSIRWMIAEVLNPWLARLGVRAGVRADHILGVTTLLADRSDRLYKDTLLVRNDPAYAALDKRRLGSFRLTSRLQFPVPTYSGKLACVFDALGRRPYLYVGDSPGDHAMLEFSQNRLWIAQLEKPAYQRAASKLIHKTGPGGWSIQPTLTLQAPGFVSSLAEVSSRLEKIGPRVRQSLRVLKQLPARFKLT